MILSCYYLYICLFFEQGTICYYYEEESSTIWVFMGLDGLGKLVAQHVSCLLQQFMNMKHAKVSFFFSPIKNIINSKQAQASIEELYGPILCFVFSSPK